MYINSNIDSPFIRLLVSPGHKILRHIILLVLNLGIVMGTVWYMQDQGMLSTTTEKYFIMLIYTCIFGGGCYLTLYVLTPRFLLKDKWGNYFLYLLGLVSLVLVCMIILQLNFQDKGNSGHINYYSIGINFLSSFLSLFLLFAGVSTLVLFQSWIRDVKQAQELESATMQLELKLLENQINPHFLFNMLNNANIMIKKDPDIAVQIIYKLEDMLRYLMKENSRDKVYLKQDILFLNDYLELEKTRRDDFTYTIHENGDIGNAQIPPLLFITFVENAVKHNLDSNAASFANLSFDITKNKLTFICENSVPHKTKHTQAGGIGLNNVERRLNLLYGNNYSLEQTKSDNIYTVKLELKL
ncbi:MAG TPA: histidine kinase [Dysgonomonas sp.]|nr:histidine kinase [Dysgonomonas sp.]